ncbi:MAG TPA: ATP-binding protein [Selenomonadales bacterium]|nr:ATP-binding protein [Selenomonadales bacterium]
MFNWGIRTRLITSYLLVVAVVLTLLGSYILWYFHRHTVDSLSANLLTQAEVISDLLTDKLDDSLEPPLLDATVKELSQRVNLRVTVVDTSGRVLADSWENPAAMENHGQRPEIMTALTTGYGSATRYSATLNENMLYVAIPIRHGGAVIGALRVSNTLSYVEEGFSQIRTVLLIALFLTSLLALAISIGLARTYTSPLEKIIATAQEIADGRLDSRVHVRTGDEIELLAGTLNTLASNLEDKVSEITAEKSKLELIFRHTNSALMLLTRHGLVVDVNKAAIDTFHITPVMLGQHNLQVIGNGLFDKALQEAATRRESRLLDLKTDIQGVKRVFEVFIAPISGGETGTGSILAVFHDITALRDMQEKQADFVANASHELATPLTAIKGFAETLLDGALKDPGLSTRFITIIHDEADRMHRLIKDLLQLAKLDSQDYRHGITVEPTLIEPVVATAVNDLAATWTQKQLTVAIHAADEPLAVQANADWLKQVVLNLLDNAIKYTPAGGYIAISWRKDRNQAIFTVEDSGIGIPAEDLPRIFDRFYRVDRARTRAAGGTGLGLAIVKFIIETFGGKIEAKNNSRGGTTMQFQLPLAAR